MAKVLRGGKWGSVSRVSSSRTGTANNDSDENLFEIENQNNQDTGTVISFFEEKKQLGVACYDIAKNEMILSICSSENEYANATQVVSALDVCVVVLPKSYSYNDNLLRAVRNVSQNEQSAATARQEHDREVSTDTHTTKQANNSPQRSQNGTPSHSEPNTPSEHIVDANSAPDHDSGNLISYLPNIDFSHKKSAELCGFLNVRGMPDGMNPQEKLAYLSHLLGEEGCILCSVGGLLSYIVQNGILRSISDEEDTIQLNSIQHRNFCNVMTITPTTLRALRVFSQDAHPMGRGAMKGKEGLSLYGVLKGGVKTVAGRNLFHMWLRYPSTCADVIAERQVVVEALRKSSNSAVLVTLKDALKGVKNVPGILCRFRKFVVGVSDWKALYSSVKSFSIIQNTLNIAFKQSKELSESSLIIDYLNVCEEDLRLCINSMDTVIDFEESTVARRMIVAHGFSEELDELKRIYSGLDDFLTNLGIDETKKLKELENGLDVSALHFKYLPQIGFLVVLPADDCNQIGIDALEGLGFTFLFKSVDNYYHFKNDRCRELDNDLEDIHATIVDKEETEFRQLQQEILSCATSLFKMADLSRQLDCLQAMASCANEYSWSKPKVTMNGESLVIEGGRHPLVELVVPSFVPNSTNIRFGDVHVITGPNYSGKSVYLSHAALIVVLAHIGSCVPAKKAIVPIIHSINTRIMSFESVSYGQSSFFMDACQVSKMLSPSTGRSMNLIDEYGKGTNEIDGMALLAATLRGFLRAPVANAPICICTTHFVDILREPFLPMDSTRIRVSSMEVVSKPMKGAATSEVNSLAPSSMLRELASARSKTAKPASRKEPGSSKGNTGVAEPNEQVKHESAGSVVRTYRLVAGSICEESRALQCALEAGVPKFILERAAHIREAIVGNRAIENAVASASDDHRIRNCLDSVQRLLNTDLENEHLDIKSFIDSL